MNSEKIFYGHSQTYNRLALNENRKEVYITYHDNYYYSNLITSDGNGYGMPIVNLHYCADNAFVNYDGRGDAAMYHE